VLDSGAEGHHRSLRDDAEEVGASDLEYSPLLSDNDLLKCRNRAGPPGFGRSPAAEPRKS
jgi:hypothetical protein